MQELFELAIGGLRGGRESSQPPRIVSHIGYTRYSGLRGCFQGSMDESGDQPIHQAAHYFLKAFVLGGAGELAFRFFVAAVEFRDRLANAADFEEAGGKSVVEISSVISDFVGKVDQLRFKRWAQPRQIFVQGRIFALFEIARMLHDANRKSTRLNSSHPSNSYT